LLRRTTVATTTCASRGDGSARRGRRRRATRWASHAQVKPGVAVPSAPENTKVACTRQRPTSPRSPVLRGRAARTAARQAAGGRATRPGFESHVRNPTAAATDIGALSRGRHRAYPQTGQAAQSRASLNHAADEFPSARREAAPGPREEGRAVSPPRLAAARGNMNRAQHAATTTPARANARTRQSAR